MARSATTTDVFNAIAESQRREILTLLAQGERSVNDVAESLHVRQPQASRHLHVLKEVGLVSMRVSKQQRLYRLNASALKPLHDWVTPFERFWNESLERLDDYLQTGNTGNSIEGNENAGDKNDQGANKGITP